ncbi:helix-turn-helix domain-containing protein [Intestinibacter bartlettii]|uniref:helix-turn-helix domain-containing protein n=1 Tax=Intestinibacter bartlettii TaxID=261299 RepID=UPI000822DAF8|nr:helix-turn-helix transcriptional regulator [Intestinibacter bartlettii]SCJ81869.1 transcriptional regulator%2C y4mF family [uncultured Clostridium sp.]
MIQKARFNKKLTQKELGLYLGVSQSYISKIETRKTKSLSVSKILTLSLILELDPVEIFKFIAGL